MIVADSSAIIAVLVSEEDGEQFLSAVLEAPEVAISAMTLLECNTVIFWRYGQKGLDELHDLLKSNKFENKKLNEASLSIAVQAYVKYGKGVHKAGLNFGDCASYALAKQLDAPLLFKGGDFAQTDVKRC